MSSGTPFIRNNAPKIAIIRGGHLRHGPSLEEGLMFLKSLSNLGYEPMDVIVDKEGGWVHHGVPTDMHMIFTKADGYVDTTHMHDAPHHTLAAKMGIHNLFPHKAVLGDGDRESVYRLLRQRGIDVPDTVTIRKDHELSPEVFKEIWNRFHTPLIVRTLRRHSPAPRLVRSFATLVEIVTDHHTNKRDIHVLSYTHSPVYSLALLPNYRGETWYTPLPVQIFPKKDEIPNETITIHHFDKGDVAERQQIKQVALSVAEALDLKGPVCVDMIKTKRGYVVVNVDTHPTLSPTGRFMQSLSTTGVDMGHYVQSRFFL